MENYSEKSYKDKLEAIFTRFPSVQKVPFGDAYKPGLDHMEKFAALLGNPQEKYRTIHVAGTNGKGSVANMIASALSSAGLKVGLYTSPHIIDFRERARILLSSTAAPSGSLRFAPYPGKCPPEGLPTEEPVEPFLVPEEYVFDFLCRYEADMDELDLSFFEITTGLAFKWFADENVDVAVIEVGLGGRLDSTNIITPDLSIVTSIALDHCALLGDNLEDIASEKAGIFKPGVPALVGEYLPETRPVFEKQASEVECPLTFAQDVDLSMDGLVPNILENMDLKGKYQEKNLRTVLAAIDILARTPFYSKLSDQKAVVDAICHTASRAGFHGRWEMVRKDPMIIADLGHNPAALKENFAQLEVMMSSGDYSSLIIIYAVMADKDLDGIMPLMPESATYVLTGLESKRALPVGELTRKMETFLEEAGKSFKIVETGSVKEAISAALSLDKDRKPLIFIGGSTYLLSEALHALDARGF
ncbi:MAG: bifunctional folylpolyglutamate synthase/dihydrofolate synthase [Bacteroidales bacterium]|nr:bifunctional folylpolyglutamate synthase/dihydrofolate synthase [Bacteroidales bacterium]